MRLAIWASRFPAAQNLLQGVFCPGRQESVTVLETSLVLPQKALPMVDQNSPEWALVSLAFAWMAGRRWCAHTELDAQKLTPTAYARCQIVNATCPFGGKWLGQTCIADRGGRIHFLDQHRPVGDIAFAVAAEPGDQPDTRSENIPGRPGGVDGLDRVQVARPRISRPS